VQFPSEPTSASADLQATSKIGGVFYWEPAPRKSGIYFLWAWGEHISFLDMSQNMLGPQDAA